jgi:hypothetical protein
MQFSLRTLLLVPLAVACVFAVLLAKPAAVALLELFVISLVLPAVLTVIIVYGSGCKRAFCIGALFPVGALWFLSAIYLVEGVASAANHN